MIQFYPGAPPDAVLTTETYVFRLVPHSMQSGEKME